MPLLHAQHLDLLVWWNLEWVDPAPRATTLHLRCHPEAAFHVSYDAEQEAMILTCATCQQASLTIAVARQPQRVKNAP
jgi:hypothetical protein